MKMKCVRNFLVTAIGLFLLLSQPSSAEPIPGDLSITGNIEFDSDNTFADDTATGSGAIGLISGGASSLTTFDGTGSVVGSNPLIVNLTDIYDGVGGNATFSGTNTSEYLTGWDLTMDLQNSSATDTYQVNFRIDYNNSVNSSGADSYAQTLFTLGTAENDDDIFLSYLLSDTVNGNDNTALNASGFGGSLSEVGPYLFSINIDPLQTLNLFGSWNFEGGVYEDPGTDPGTSLADIDSFISIIGVENLTPPPPPDVIPEPGTFFLFGLGLLGIAGFSRKRRN